MKYTLTLPEATRPLFPHPPPITVYVGLVEDTGYRVPQQEQRGVAAKVQQCTSAGVPREHQPTNYPAPRVKGKENIMLKYVSYGEVWKITLRVNSYANGNLAITMIDHNEGWPEPFAKLTVNLDEKLPEGYAYVDVNNLDGADDWIIENGLGEFAGKDRVSGFCCYPLFKFNMDAVHAHC